MNTRRITAIALFALMIAGSAFAQRPHKEVLSMVQDGYTSRLIPTTAGAVRYGDVIDCADAEMICVMVTTTNCNATTAIGIGIEWLPEDVGASGRRRPLTLPLSGDNYPVATGWSSIDSETTNTRTSASNFLQTSYVKHRWARIGVSCLVTDAVTPYPTVTVRYCLRYKKID
jgi:hypothetical protein